MPAISDSVFHSRAVPSSDDLENDPDVMVHQQLARLNFFHQQVGTAGRTVLDFGCGTGFNCSRLKNAARVFGFDFSADAVALARKMYPECTFEVADECDPKLNLGQFERIICCEVIEHAPAMDQFSQNVSRHLTKDGVAFITTPNVAVFSNGHRPSPMNREHIREVDIEEFRHLLRHFREVRIFGQRFIRGEQTAEWGRNVDRKIKLLQAGTRWQQPPARHPLLKVIHSFPPVKWAWMQYRWRFVESRNRARTLKSRPYSFRDFEFVENDFNGALWFCAVVRN